MVRRLDAVLEVRGGGGSSASAASSRRLPSTTPTEAHVAPKTAPKRTRRFLCYLLALTVMFALTPVVVVLAGLGDATCPSSVSSGPSTARGRALSMQALRRECAAAEILTAEGFPVVLKRKRSIFNNVLTPHNSSRASEPDGMRWGLAPDAPLLVFTTQMSMDRLPRLPRLLAAWDGPISVAVSLCTGSELSVLRAAFEASPPLRSNVFLHVVVGHEGYFPINFLRNVAAEAAAAVSDWAVVSDIDMLPSHSMAQMSTDVAGGAAAILSAGAALTGSVLVLPALEGTSEDIPISSVVGGPKSELQVQWEHNRIQTMHPYHPPSYHGPFDISVWMRRDQAYEVQYERHFEGYYIAHQPILPFDERFVGRRRNKMSQWFEMWAAGYRFWVLPHSWVVDVPHTPGIRQARVELMFRRKWHAFVSEIVAKYDVQCTRPDRHCWWMDENLETYPIGESIREHMILWTQRLLCSE